MCLRNFLIAFSSVAIVFAAQEKDATFSTDVKVVNVFATVRDKQGKIVPNLNKEDFALTENGTDQPIRYFSREVDQPLTIGLLVDTSGSQRRVLPQEKSASFTFLDKVLKPDRDRTFVIHFDFETELLQDLTSSRTELQHALDLLELPANQRAGRGGGNNGGNNGGSYPGGQQGQGGQRSGGIGGIPGLGGSIGFPGGGRGMGGGMGRGGRGMGRGGNGGPQQGRGRGAGGGGTTLYDAIYLASDEVMRRQTGRKTLILLTDGVDMGSKTSLNTAIESAQRADTLVYSILFTDQDAYQGRGGGDHADGRRVLQRLAQETGGSYYEVSKKLSIEQIYERLQEELRNQYSLGYTPAAGSVSDFRTIKVATKRSGLVVQAREGYYPAAPATNK